MSGSSHGPVATLLADEVMRLFELRQSSAVPQWLAARLSELCGADGQRVLRVFPIEASRCGTGANAQFAFTPDAPMIDELPAPIVDDAQLVSAIAGRSPVRAPGSRGARLIVPLSAGDEVRHVVELDLRTAAGPGEALAQALIPLAMSFYDLLADAETDPLTRLANRRVFYSHAGAGLARRSAGACMRYLALADIDHFKQVNDRFGHLYGDEILIHFARLMRSTFRAGDLLHRFGGEEFVMVFGVERPDDRGQVLERFRRAVEEYEFPRVGRVTVSIGYTALEGPLVPATTFVDRADKAVYCAKRDGRNRVCEYEALVAAGAIALPRTEPGGEATLF